MAIIDGDQIKAEELVDIPTQRFLWDRFPEGAKGLLLTGKGAEVNPAYDFPIGSSQSMADVSLVTGRLTLVAGTWTTIFNVASELVLLNGVMWSFPTTYPLSKLGFTIDGGSRAEVEIGVWTITLPPIIVRSSLKIEAYVTSTVWYERVIWYKLL